MAIDQIQISRTVPKIGMQVKFISDYSYFQGTVTYISDKALFVSVLGYPNTFSVPLGGVVPVLTNP